MKLLQINFALFFIALSFSSSAHALVKYVELEKEAYVMSSDQHKGNTEGKLLSVEFVKTQGVKIVVASIETDGRNGGKLILQLGFDAVDLDFGSSLVSAIGKTIAILNIKDDFYIRITNN